MTDDRPHLCPDDYNDGMHWERSVFSFSGIMWKLRRCPRHGGCYPLSSGGHERRIRLMVFSTRVVESVPRLFFSKGWSVSIGSDLSQSSFSLHTLSSLVKLKSACIQAG